MPPHQQPTWLHGDNGLVLRLGYRRDPVPEPLDQWLIGPSGIGLSADAAEDLVRLESRLRHVVAQLVQRLGQADQRVADARAEVDAAKGRRGLRARVRRRQADQTLGTAKHEHGLTAETLSEARTLLEVLRSYVIDLDPPHGLLREAADGWRRNPEPPPSVVVFDDERRFLDTDPRRATANGWGGPTIADIEPFGFAWRRDGDENDLGNENGDLNLTGPWQIGYIERTAEIYAIRRSEYLSQQVWLLGTGFDTVLAARNVLLPIMPRMREPNSLILAAGAVHASRTWRSPTTVVGGVLPHHADSTDGRDEEAR